MSFASGEVDVRGRAGSVTDLPCIHVDQMMRHLDDYTALQNSEGQFSGNSAQKDRQERCKTPQWRCWFDGSQPPQ